jgi:hypothetical protein
MAGKTHTMNLEQVKKIKRALFIENEDWSSMQNTEIGSLHRKFGEYGIHCVVIERAAHHKEEVFKEAMQADAILFASTFVYSDEVRSVGNLLKAIKESKLIFGYSMNSREDLQASIENLWKVDELVEFGHHRLFEISNSFIDDAEMKWCKEIDMSVYQKEMDRLEDERLRRNAGFKRIATNVLIKKINAQGKEWSLLKEGDVVQELDCSSIDPNPKRGIWVMGLTEPVKLLNDSGNEEWEYKDPNCFQLAKEFFKRACRYGEDMELLDIVGNIIGKSTGKLKMDGSELWEYCDNICKILSVERRGNRHYFERRINEHRERFVYFRDKAVWGV